MAAPRTNCEGDDPAPYTGPVPIVTHLHGAHVDWTSDGYPGGLVAAGGQQHPGRLRHHREPLRRLDGDQPGQPRLSPTTIYRNDQPATTLWYHDHALGMTRTNVYAGLAGFWLIRGDHADAGGGRR